MSEPACATIEHRLWSDPSSATAPEVAAHLTNCAACAESARALTRLEQVLRSEPAPPEPPADFVGAVLREVDALETQRAHELRWLRTRVLTAAAAVLLLLGVGALAPSALDVSPLDLESLRAPQPEWARPLSGAQWEGWAAPAWDPLAVVEASGQSLREVVAAAPSVPGLWILALVPVWLIANWWALNGPGGARPRVNLRGAA